MLIGCIDQFDDAQTSETHQSLVPGAPLIVSTSINAPVVSGRYQLILGKSYTATVVVDAGTITYLTRVESSVLPAATSVTPAFRDDTVVGYSGKYVYTFSFTPNTTGNSAISFRIRDRGTNNIYNTDTGVAVAVSSAFVGPRIAETTINAPIWAGRYQLFIGQAYQVTVRVAMSNVTYSARVEGNSISPTLNTSPSTSSYTAMPGFGSDQIYTFAIVPSSAGLFQVGFRLRDSGTGNSFAIDPGVSVTVHGTGAPRITSTTILLGTTAAPIRNGQYILEIGRRYDVVVHVEPGTATYTAAVEVNDQLPTIPSSANLHNRRTTHVFLDTSWDFHFTLTPTEHGEYQVGFMMRDCLVGTGASCTGNTFSWHPGVRVVAATPISAPGPLYGYVTRVSDGMPMAGAKVMLETGSFVNSASDGRYFFSSVPTGSHTLTVTAPVPPGGFSTTIVSHLTVPVAGIRVDIDLDEFFSTLASSGLTYARRIDYLRGRTLFHVVKVPRTTGHVELKASPQGGYKSARGMANYLPYIWYSRPKVTINAGIFDSPGVDANGNPCMAQYGDYVPNGYRWPTSGYPNTPCQFGGSTTSLEPMAVLGIAGTSTNQNFQIIEKSIGFDTPHWKPFQPGWPLWDDVTPLGTSDVTYAIQAYPRLVTNGAPQWGETTDFSDPSQYWARTAVGVTASGDFLMVVADGEGLSNCHGANMFVLSKFFAESLQANAAMGLDGGGSSSMVLFRDSTGTRDFINTPTSENLNSLVSRDDPATLLDFLMAW